MDKINEERASELKEQLQQMQHVANEFYHGAVRCSHHQFIEIAGFANEIIKMLRGQVTQGKDFMTEELTAVPHQMAYVAEKLDCIFGGALSDPENMEAFLTALFHKTGYSPRTSAESLRVSLGKAQRQIEGGIL